MFVSIKKYKLLEERHIRDRELYEMQIETLKSLLSYEKLTNERLMCNNRIELDILNKLIATRSDKG